MTLLLLALGLLGIVSGVLAMRGLARRLHEAWAPDAWRVLKWGALALGLALALASWMTVDAIGYAVSTPGGPGRIVGVPFFVAYFDAEGSDYIGPLTPVAAVANALFWFLVPQTVLAAVAIARRWNARNLARPAA